MRPTTLFLTSVSLILGAPLAAQGLVRRVDGMRPVDEVSAEIDAIIDGKA